VIHPNEATSGENPARRSSHPESAAAPASSLFFNPEHRDIAIPLQNVSVRLDDLATIANPIIDASLHRARHNRWETDGVTDALALMYQRRLAWQEHGTWWPDTSTYVLTPARGTASTDIHGVL
jgi:hypothetical protein